MNDATGPESVGVRHQFDFLRRAPLHPWGERVGIKIGGNAAPNIEKHLREVL
ncbi:MAG: hypothetical protein JO166_15800 [Deltaproteobacteria bacterium]|nr:hypothetical protein [Deltaproteobacteria bacterium]